MFRKFNGPKNKLPQVRADSPEYIKYMHKAKCITCDALGDQEDKEGYYIKSATGQMVDLLPDDHPETWPAHVRHGVKTKCPFYCYAHRPMTAPPPVRVKRVQEPDDVSLLRTKVEVISKTIISAKETPTYAADLKKRAAELCRELISMAEALMLTLAK